MTRRTRLAVEALEDRRTPSITPAGSYTVGTTPQTVVTADFNNDGWPDLATANTGGNTVSVLLGNGDGSFQPPKTSAAGDNPFSLAVGDFNDDGTLDLTAGSGGGGVVVMLGNRDGTFRAPTQIAVGYPTVESVATGDFNRDGRMDLAVTSTYRPPDYSWYPQGRADVLLAIGAGSFAAPRTFWFMDRASGDAVVTDMNGDGNPDLVTELADYSSIIVLLGNGQGSLSGGWTQAYANAPSAAGDLTGDGKTDLVTSSGVLFGDGTGGFLIPSPDQYHAAGSGPGTVALGDFDRDGKLDIARGDGLLRNAGGGTFSGVEGFPTGSGGFAVAAGDFNGDGWLDAATANASGNTVSVLINDQSWSPAPPTLSVGGATVTEGNAGSVNVTFTLTLSKPSAVDVTVHYDTANGDAAAGTDYVPGQGDVVIPAGQTSRTVAVAVLGDRLPEPTETFSVYLSAATNAWIDDGWGLGIIHDNEPRIGVNNVTKYEGNGKTTTFTFTVTLSAAYDQAATVNYATADGTATVGNNDYVAKSGTVTFAPGETAKTVTVVVKGDKTREANETFFVNLSGASGNALILDAQGIGTIINDDR